jgi:hypothetical protein
MHTVTTDDALLDTIGHGFTPARPDTLTRLLTTERTRVWDTPNAHPPIPLHHALAAITAGRQAYTPIRRWRVWLSGRVAVLSTRLRNHSPLQ